MKKKKIVDDFYFKKALEDCRDVISYHVHTLKRKISLDSDDVRQEIILRMWQASHKYDAKRSEIKTYFVRVIEKQVLRLIRKMNHRMKHKRVDELLHLQAEIKNDGDKDGSCSTLMDVIFDEKYDLFKKKEEELEIWHKLKDIYNYIEDSQAKRIFRLLCREAIKNNNVATIERVAEKLNMTRQGIYKIIRKKIKPIVVDRMK